MTALRRAAGAALALAVLMVPSAVAHGAPPTPTVTGVSPAAGPVGGGTQVTVTGSGFTGATAVAFGNSQLPPCTQQPQPCFTVNLDSSITAPSPPQAAGTVDVTVTSSGGTSATSSNDLFAYAPVPTVTGLSKSQGPIAGGIMVTVTGTGFQDPSTGLYTATASVGGTAVAVSTTSPTSLSLTTPAENAGVADITLTTAGGTSATGPADHFTFVQPAPAVTGVSPGAGVTSGGTPVSVTGSDLSGAGFTVTAVAFGPATVTTACSGSPPPCFTVNSPTSLSVSSPPAGTGQVDVTVTTNAGDGSTPQTSATSGADQFLYQQPAPTVSGLAPAFGPPAGGIPVTVTGTAFSGSGFGVTAVTVDTTTTKAVCDGASPPGNQPCFTVTSATGLTVFMPAHALGTVDVTVTTSSTDLGTVVTSGISRPADVFNYGTAPPPPPPVLTVLSPHGGPPGGGTTVTVSGSGFLGATGVTFGGNPATVVHVISDTSLTVVSPAHTPGGVFVQVHGPTGTSPVTVAGLFTYVTQGYWLVATDGGIFPFGSAAGLGSTGGIHLNQPMVGMARTSDGGGYWLVASDGGIFPFGDAGGHGSTGGIHLNQPIVGMAATPDGGGYWLVARDGGIFPFGDAGGFGSTGGIHLNRPIVGMVATPDGAGYWLVASDGGIFPFGDAGGFGSTGGVHLNQPIVGMAATRDGGGYWLVASDGGIFPFGDAGGFGSTGGIHLNQPIVAMAPTSDGGGYWLVASDGGIFPFGDAAGLGSTGGIHLNRPIVGIAAQG